MKKKIALLAILGMASLTPTVFGQYVYLIQKSENFIQTGTGATESDAGNPYKFTAQISGDPQDASTPATASNITTPASAFDALAFNSSDGQWEFKASNFASQAAMDTAFPDGTYSFDVGGNTASISLTGDTYPNTPFAIVSGGTWSNGTLYVTPGQDLTINTNVFSTNFVSGMSRIGIDAQPQNGGSDVSYDTFSDGVPPLTESSANITIPGADLLSGNIFNLSIEFDAFSALNTDGINGGTNVGIYDAKTNFQIDAGAAPVPEPAETALLAGMLGLGLASYWRRRVRA